MKKHIYRVGDKVRIVNPLFVRRVGYPLVWTEVTDEQLDNDEHSAKVAKAMRGCEPSELPRYLQIAIAKMYVEERAFGGNERSIHYRPEGDGGWQMPLNWTYGPAEVVRKRLVKTGTRFPASQGYIGRDYEVDYMPGGLADCKTHVLLDLGMGYEIEACNVEPT
jgi:hypothetical protein